MMTLISLIATLTTAHASPPCPAGAWDLGPQAAALYLDCSESSPSADLYFCKRERLIRGNECNHIGAPVPCSVEDGVWVCENKGERFRAELRWTGEEKIQYKFQSSFNSGEIEGKRF